MQKIAFLTLFSISLLCSSLSHAMDLNQALQELSDQGLEQEEDQYSDGSDSDSEITDSEDDELEQEREESPLDSYCKQLRNYEKSSGQNPITTLREVIMLPKPEDQATHEMAHKFLTYRIAAMLVKIKYADANPNEINPETGNTALADFFINHHANNAYMPAVIESMAEYGACLENITHKQSNFRDLVQNALVNGTLTQDQYGFAFREHNAGTS